MWADAQRDGCPAEYRWCPLCEFRNSIPCTTSQSLADAHCWSAVHSRCQYSRMQDLDAKWILHVAKFHHGARAPKNIYVVCQPRKWPNTMQSFVDFPLSDVAAVTKARRETGWNLLGCLKLANQCQSLVHRSSSCYEDMCRRYCCSTSFFPIVDTCLSCEDIARQSCTMVRRWWFFASCISSKPHAAHFRHASWSCTMATSCVEVW